jgi:glycosyltransferase involved in cell wall biosynthesis
MNKVSELSVFFPAVNEEKNIKETVEKAVAVLPTIVDKWKVIVVDDGSTDKTSQIVKDLIKNNPRIRMITHTPNRGYGAALKSGFYNAKYSWIAYTDADGQFDFAELNKFVEKQKETNADLVIGYYLKRQVPYYRIIGSKVWELAVLLLFGLKVRDIDCGFKLIRKEVIDKIPRLQAERGPFITSELLIKAKKAGFKITEVGVSHYPRKAGKSTGADLKVVIGGLKDLVKLRVGKNV